MFDKFVPCRKCNQKPNTGIPVGFFKVDKDGQTFIQECEHHIAWKKKRKLEDAYMAADFNPTIFDLDFDSYKGDKSRDSLNRVIKYLSLFDTDKRDQVKSSVLYFYGPNGTQKTTIAQITGRKLLEKGLKCEYVLMKSLITALVNSVQDFDNAEDFKKMVNGYYATDVLIIDEAFSKDKLSLWKSGFQIGFVDEFLREHLNKGKGIIFISNTEPGEIEAQGFSHSIQDLVKRELMKNQSLLLFEDRYVDCAGEIPATLF